MAYQCNVCETKIYKDHTPVRCPNPKCQNDDPGKFSLIPDKKSENKEKMSKRIKEIEGRYK